MGDASPDATPVSSPRGEATRQALVEAAIELFGRRGYHAASNRALAEAAGVNAALIGYHFGGKRGLYLAAFEHIAERMHRRIGPVAAAIEAELDDIEEDGARDAAEVRAELVAALHRLLDRFVTMLTADESAPWARLVVREQQDPTDALDILFRGPLGRMLRLATRLLMGIERLDEGARAGEGEEERSRLKALTVFGQALVFRVARATALRHLGWEGIGPREVELIQRQIRRNASAILKEGSSE